MMRQTHVQLPRQRTLRVVTRIVGVNMLRVLLYTALALNFSALAVTATDRYGGWLLEQQRSYVHTLSFKQSVQFNNNI